MSHLAGSMRDALAFANSSRVLADLSTDVTPLAPVDEAGLPKKLKTDSKRIADLQEKLWAESTSGSKRRILLVLQGIDTAGKGGTVEHVIGACGPIGVQYSAFKKPTKEELAHDFLWRIRRRTPEPGMIGIFDRSHYEDVLVARVHELVEPAEIETRYETINAFERELVAEGTTVVKVFLHISYDVQRKRLLARLKHQKKHWKFSENDITERTRWSDYQHAFELMLQRCDTAQAPWYVVPSDSKKYRNWAVAQLLLETLESLDPHYPAISLDVPRLRERLAPPN